MHARRTTPRGRSALRLLGWKALALTLAFGPAAHAACGRAVLYLNFQGGHLTHGEEDATRNSSAIAVETDYPPFNGADEDRDAAVALVRKWYAPFAVDVVTERPSQGPYTMALIGGVPSDILPGASDFSAAGYSLEDCGNHVPSNIVFMFSETETRNGARTKPLAYAIARGIAHEAAHAFGLSHVEDPDDLMNPSASSLRGGFHDRRMPTYRGSVACDGTRKQNSAKLLEANLSGTCTANVAALAPVDQEEARAIQPAMHDAGLGCTPVPDGLVGSTRVLLLLSLAAAGLGLLGRELLRNGRQDQAS